MYLWVVYYFCIGFGSIWEDEFIVSVQGRIHASKLRTEQHSSELNVWCYRFVSPRSHWWGFLVFSLHCLCYYATIEQNKSNT